MGREGLSSFRFTWDELRYITSWSELTPPALFNERKMEKMATIWVRAGGMKQPQNLLLTTLLLWPCFGMTVCSCLMTCDELSSFRKWKAHSQHVFWTELLWDLRQKTCPDESWLWLSKLEAVPSMSNRHSRHLTGKIWAPKCARRMGYCGFLDTKDWNPTKS